MLLVLKKTGHFITITIIIIIIIIIKALFNEGVTKRLTNLCPSDSRSNWILENRSTQRKTSRTKDNNKQQTQPTFDAESGNRTRATLVAGLGGRQMLNHCAIPPAIKVNRTIARPPCSLSSLFCLRSCSIDSKVAFH